jgi:hypothetical protein
MAMDPERRPFSVAAWCQTRVSSGEILSKYAMGSLGSGGSSDIEIGIGPALGVSDGLPAFAIRDSGGSAQVVTGASRVDDGRWHLLAGVRDTLRGLLTLYVDGTPYSQPLTVTGAIFGDGSKAPVILASSDLCCGRTVGGPGYDFTGLLDEIAVFRRALQPQEMAGWFASGNEALCPIQLPFVVNGDFGAPGAAGWRYSDIDSSGGYFSSGGNPGAYFVLNSYGGATDPTISQTVDGLVVGNRYRLSGDFASVYSRFGDPSALSFGVLVDGSPILQLARPKLPGSDGGNPSPEGWAHFEAVFKASASSAEVAFAGERNGDDSSYAVDNIAIEVVDPAPAPDLLVSNPQLGGSPFFAGSEVAVSWTLSNVGNRTADTFWYDRLVVSNRTLGLVVSDTLVAYDGAASPLAVGASVSRSEVILLPRGAESSGDLEFTIIADAHLQVQESDANPNPHVVFLRAPKSTRNPRHMRPDQATAVPYNLYAWHGT